jgi:hypothetical protein
MRNFFSEMREYTWDTGAGLIRSVRPDFAAVLDDLSPDKSHTFHFIKYPYGALPLYKGVFQVPNQEGEIVPITHSSVSKELRNNLSYSGTIPLGLVVNNGFESFIQTPSRVLPSALMGVGKFLSLWRILEESDTYYLGPLWNYTAGARSICMLPKITDSVGHKNLKTKYGLKLPIPEQLSSHWSIFKYLANHQRFSQEWSADVIFFSKQWLTHKKDKGWSEFYRFLLNEVWQTASYRRNQFIFDSAVSMAIENRNLKPNPYLTDTAKYLLAIASGSFPSFSPAIDDSAAPVKGLQKIYLEDYGIKKYFPIIMQAYHYSQQANRVGFYSFQLPNTIIFSPKSRKLSSTMVELHELKHIMECFISEVLNEHLGVEQTSLFDIVKNIEFGYYHADPDRSGEILPTTKIQKIDCYDYEGIKAKKNYMFPEFAPFFRGCVSISKK